VSAELEVYALELSWVFDQLAASLAGLDEHLADRRGGTANSPSRS
jgi:hypothetical protein